MATRLAALAIAAISASVAAFECGVDHPAYHDQVHHGQDDVHVQSYVGEEESVRRLQNGQTYSDSLSFTPIATLAANSPSSVAPIRIKAIWGLMETAQDPNYQCNSLGQSIQVKDTSGNWVSWSGCAAEHLITGAGGAARLAVLKSRTNEAIQYWVDRLKVKPVQDAITLGSAVMSAFPNIPAAEQSHSDADLVMIMTARPSPNSPIAGFATCYQRDQRGRCTVGHFNWVPEVINVADTNSADVHESEKHTALHEIVHVLGGMSPGASVSQSPFLDASGAQVGGSTTHLVEEDPAYSGLTPQKMRTLIVTPKVKNFTQTYFDCPAAQGFPLEDVPLGKGSHWEARVAGPELMSYGSGSGQIYVSDLTMGFLEDTGHYLPDYSKAGPILVSEYDDFKTAGGALKSLQSATTSEQYTPPPGPPPGVPRWGYKRGCAFLDSHPRTWPSSYVCTKNQEYGCTPDNRMSAVCVIRSDWTGVESNPTCGKYVQDNSGVTGPSCTDRPSDATTTGTLPTWFRFFDSDSAAIAASGVVTTAATTGGYNNAMDYVPINVGYWNCMYARPSDNSSGSYSGQFGGLSGVSSLFGSSSDMNSFGGQARCPQCRCFKSSLIEMSKGQINPKFPQYGLCYRSNCYRSDYLQVAVKGQLDGSVYWYKCPTSGGKLYIPGFFGALHCPAAADFCGQEQVTGVRYPEQDVVLEAVFWGIVCGGFLITMFICTCPCLRDRCINCSKSCCGARAFEAPEEKDVNGEVIAPPEAPPLPKCASWVVCGVNTLTLLVGLAILGVTGYTVYASKLYSVTISAIGLGILISLLSTTGVCASRKRAEHGPSCWLLTYFLGTLVLAVLLTWGIAWTFAFKTYGTYVDRYFDVIVDAGLVKPAAYGNATHDQLVEAATEEVGRNINVIGGLCIAVLVVMLIPLISAGSMIRGRTLVSMLITFLNNIMLVFGVLFTIVGFYLLALHSKSVAGAVEVVGVIIAIGVFFFVDAILGHVGIFKKKTAVLIAYMVFSLLLAGLTAAGCWVCFMKSGLVSGWLEKQDDTSIGEIASALGVSADASSIQGKLEGNLRQLGLACGVIMIIQVLLIVATVLFLWAVRAWRAENGLTAAEGAKAAAGVPTKAPKPAKPADAARAAAAAAAKGQKPMGAHPGPGAVAMPVAMVPVMANPGPRGRSR